MCLKGDVKDVLLLDVTPLSLGIETKGGVMTKLIERNTTIPTKRTEVFTTADDMQPSVEIHVLQGEREMAGYNKTLGKFQLVDLPPAPRGVPQIEVTFDIDANGIVHVSAKDRATGKEQSMTITGQSTLDKKDIDQMIRDAEAHAEDDRKRREEAEIRNNADSLVYQMEKVLRDNADKVDAAEKATVEGPLAELKTALAGSDIDAIRAGHEKLSAASQAFSQKLYESAARDENAAGTSASGQQTNGGTTEQRRRHRRCGDCGRSVSDVTSRPSPEGPVTGEDPPTSPTARGPRLPPAPPSDASSDRPNVSEGEAEEPGATEAARSLDEPTELNLTGRAGRVDGAGSTDCCGIRELSAAAGHPTRRRHRPGYRAVGRGAVTGARCLRSRVLAAPRRDRTAVQPDAQ